MELQRGIEKVGYHFLGDVVSSGAKPTGGEHGTGSSESIGDHVTDLVAMVRHRSAPGDSNAVGGQGARDLRSIGVHGHPEQQLGADGDQFDFH